MDIGTDVCPYRHLSLKCTPIISEIFQKFSDFFLKLSELFQKNSDIFLYIPALAASHSHCTPLTDHTTGRLVENYAHKQGDFLGNPNIIFYLFCKFHLSNLVYKT